MEPERERQAAEPSDDERVDMPEIGGDSEIDSLLDAADRILDSVQEVDAEQFLRRNQQQGGQ